jgi:hypothetical protein
MVFYSAMQHQSRHVVAAVATAQNQWLLLSPLLALALALEVSTTAVLTSLAKQ